MITFDVQDMSCGHCASTITRAVQRVDAAAAVQIDLPGHRVDVTPAAADAGQIERAIREAGYTPVPVSRAAA